MWSSTVTENQIYFNKNTFNTLAYLQKLYAKYTLESSPNLFATSIWARGQYNMKQSTWFSGLSVWVLSNSSNQYKGKLKSRGQHCSVASDAMA